MASYSHTSYPIRTIELICIDEICTTGLKSDSIFFLVPDPSSLEAVSIVVTPTHIFFFADFFQWIFSNNPGSKPLGFKRCAKIKDLTQVVGIFAFWNKRTFRSSRPVPFQTYYDDKMEKTKLTFSSSSSNSGSGQEFLLTLETESSLRDFMNHVKVCWEEQAQTEFEVIIRHI